MKLYPLRAVDVIPIDIEGETHVVMADSEGYVDSHLVLSPLALLVASHFTGTNDARKVQAAVARHLGGQLIPLETIEQLAGQLDDAGFLESPGFAARRAEAEAAYHAAPVRPAYLAGKSYPENPDELRAYLDGLFAKHVHGGAAAGPSGDGQQALRCLVAPHIDFERGAAAYAHAYSRLRAAAPPKTVLVFGVAHQAPPIPFVLTRKHFDTPLGCLQADLDIIERLAASCAWDPFEHEMVHRTEHSIELQAVMLAYLFGVETRIVPVLCSALDHVVAGGDPTTDAGIEAFLAACRAEVAGSGEVSVVAGADLAHVGKRFGDPFDIDTQVVEAVQARDEEDLAYVYGADPPGWLGSVMRDGNARRVCGLHCIYAALKSVEGQVSVGEPLYYGHAPDPAGGIVTFAGAALR